MIKRNYRFFDTLAIGLSVALLAACSDSDTPLGDADGNGSDTPLADPGSSGDVVVQDVETALADFPDSLLPRFALSNSEVTAVEVFRRIEYAAGSADIISYGVEGDTEDELLELEARYANDGALLESVRNDILDELPEPIDTALRARYPDAVINEIERSTIDGSVAYAILLDTMGEEIEANYDGSATLLFVEDVEPRENIPATILAIADAQGVTLPDAEWEITTFPDDTLEYAVEYENDEGQSITVALNVSGDIIRVEHEDALANLSSSETVQDALVGFPVGIEADFAAMFTEVTAAEIFRNQDIDANGDTTTRYGIEGLSADESIEIEALYSAEVVLLEQGRGELVDTLPVSVETAFNARYPGAAIEEIVQTMADDGMGYEILFVLNEEEQEANFSSDGTFESLETVLEEDQIPAVILATVGAERVLLPIVEFELVTEANGSVSYGAEYENDEGDSISYELDADGRILQVDHEAALNQ